MAKKERWEPVLYRNFDFADNYSDDAQFLNQLRKNGNRNLSLSLVLFETYIKAMDRLQKVPRKFVSFFVRLPLA